MNFDRLFQALSYSAVFCGFLALWISGTFGLIGTAAFVGILITAWMLEGTRWQVSERVGTVLIVAALPIYYLLWRYRFFDISNADTVLPGILARLILTLTAIKLLQRKSDRDWTFLYIMAFFEILLAAGLSISALYLLSFVGFVFVMVCTIILFEIRRTDRTTLPGTITARKVHAPRIRVPDLPVRRLPAMAIALIAFIVMIATPLFFLLPRVGGAGIGGGTNGVSTYSGFSDTVRLGGIGRIQQNEQVVMRIRVEDRHLVPGELRWRGVALDTFDNQIWSKSRAAIREPRTRGDRDVIQVDYATGRDTLVLQTVYLEPLDTPVLFALARPVGIQGNFPVIFKDADGSLILNRLGERSSYKVVSDPYLPSVEQLRKDRESYEPDADNYLQLPREMDGRIAELAASITENDFNRYDAASSIESYLQSQFGYTLEQKAGGSQPLTDFLFNVREGHCEYFATAMAIMLRTQGVATRVVNGFQQGEYNETADVYIVRQREAHSWVEVYFPGEDVWVPFDPTPFAGQNGAAGLTGLTARFGKYLEALEMFWIQYFVAFDNQEQRSLFTTVRRSFTDYNEKASSWLNKIRDLAAAWWSEVRGDSGLNASLVAVGYGIAVLFSATLLTLLLRWLYRYLIGSANWMRFRQRVFGRHRVSVIEFYERLEAVLAKRGLTRKPYQTPLEFAYATAIPEAVSIAEKYNRVRYGERALSAEEAEAINDMLAAIESERKTNASLIPSGD
jgi:transglutaminase-like putative cysteine protease